MSGFPIPWDFPLPRPPRPRPLPPPLPRPILLVELVLVEPCRLHYRLVPIELSVLRTLVDLVHLWLFRHNLPDLDKSGARLSVGSSIYSVLGTPGRSTLFIAHRRLQHNKCCSALWPVIDFGYPTVPLPLTIATVPPALINPVLLFVY